MTRARGSVPHFAEERTPGITPVLPTLGIVTPLPKATIAKARLAVCGMAADVDEAREVLDALGILP